MERKDFDPELFLLCNSSFAVTEGAELHQVASAPLFTRDAANISGQTFQRGLLGTVAAVHSERDTLVMPTDPRLYLNLNAPTSGLVCGVQGSGKSHTVSCILESALIKDPRIGSISSQLATLVFNYDEEGSCNPSEAAFVTTPQAESSVAAQSAVVLVSPTNIEAMRKAYSNTPNVQVQPFYLNQSQLSASRMLTLMGCQDMEKMPLYLHTVLSTLRQMGPNKFNYKDFKSKILRPEMDGKQKSMLGLRLSLLDSYLTDQEYNIARYFKEGQMVVVDLTDPFLDASTANALFNICLGTFMETNLPCGRLIVVDEAHKYLSPVSEGLPSPFVKSLCSIIRQQRHLGTRVVIATQEPTIVPTSILSLLSWIICHRFQSPSWAEFIHRYVFQVEDAKTANSSSSSNITGFTESNDWREKVVTLRTGEALLFSPGTLTISRTGQIRALGKAYMTIRTRPRITKDGGASVFSVSIENIKTTKPRVELGSEPPSTQTSPKSFTKEAILQPPKLSRVEKTPLRFGINDGLGCLGPVSIRSSDSIILSELSSNHEGNKSVVSTAAAEPDTKANVTPTAVITIPLNPEKRKFDPLGAIDNLEPKSKNAKRSESLTVPSGLQISSFKWNAGQIPVFNFDSSRPSNTTSKSTTKVTTIKINRGNHLRGSSRTTRETTPDSST